MNRLSTFNSAAMQYDVRGNVTAKSDVGTFTYDDTLKPYAVTGASAASGTISSDAQDITYYTFPRPRQIAEGAYTLDFTYDGDLDRVKEEVKQNGTTIEVRYSLGGCYDYMVSPQYGVTEEDLYFCGDYYNAPILLQRYNDNSFSVNHLVRDYQGSIMSLVDPSGYWHSDWSYDAWGRPRNPQTHAVYNPSALTTYSSAYRGYCGHEHLPQFGLINMNARLYDPITSRFLSPDPYVQSPENSQNFNRYSYCLNNPTKYTDPSGELFIIDDWIIGFFKGIKHKPFRSANRHATNSMKIWAGLFTLDGNKNLGEKTWELVSRFTWQAPQTILGNSIAHFNNTFGNVSQVQHIYGVTVLKQENLNLMPTRKAMSVGNFIVGGSEIEADPHNYLFQHEYGHYIQSRYMGPLYLFAVAIPSLFNAAFLGNHRMQSYERGASIHAFMYFNKYVKGFYQTKDDYFESPNTHWNYSENPISDIYNEYIDYGDEQDVIRANNTIPSFYNLHRF